MNESPLIQNVHPDKRSVINHDDKVSHFIDDNNVWKFFELTKILPAHIRKIVDTPIPINDIHKIIWKYTTDCKFSVKTVTWANNDKIPPHLKQRLLTHI